MLIYSVCGSGWKQRALTMYDDRLAVLDLYERYRDGEMYLTGAFGGVKIFIHPIQGAGPDDRSWRMYFAPRIQGVDKDRSKPTKITKPAPTGWKVCVSGSGSGARLGSKRRWRLSVWARRSIATSWGWRSIPMIVHTPTTDEETDVGAALPHTEFTVEQLEGAADMGCAFSVTVRLTPTPVVALVLQTPSGAPPQDGPRRRR
jgi:hypothetical protein